MNNMRCTYCNKEINEGTEAYELLSCDGDFIHTACKPKWNNWCDKIDSMSDKEFEDWLLGKTDIKEEEE